MLLCQIVFTGNNMAVCVQRNGKHDMYKYKYEINQVETYIFYVVQLWQSKVKNYYTQSRMHTRKQSANLRADKCTLNKDSQ